MTTKTIYRYTDGIKLVDSPIKPQGDYTERIQLIADDGKVLTNGTIKTGIINADLADVGLWAEIDAPPEPADTDPESIIAEMEAVL